MRKKHYDVIVVGCGPGGAMAGKYAALGGAETLIVEQKRQLGFPVHDSMGIIYSRSEMEGVTGEKIDPAMIYGPAGLPASLPLNWQEKGGRMALPWMPSTGASWMTVWKARRRGSLPDWRE